MDVLVERTPVQRSMRPIMPCILQDEEDSNLVGHGQERGKRDASSEAKIYGHWVEEPEMFSNYWI